MAGAPTRTREIVTLKGSLALKSCQFLSVEGDAYHMGVSTKTPNQPLNRSVANQS